MVRHNDLLIYAGAIVGVFGVMFTCLAVSLYPRYHALLLRKVRTLHAFSPIAAGQLDVIDGIDHPSVEALSRAPKLAISDLMYAWLNARENLRLANEQRLDGSAAAHLLIEKLRRNNLELQQLFISSAWERIGPGCYSLYTEALLWTYSEGQELVRMLADHCSDEGKLQLLGRV